MAAPNPRSKLLPARGNLADLEFLVEDLLEGEMCYAYDLDQYYQKEAGLLVAVGASKAQGAKADSALQDSPVDSKQYGRSGGAWVEIDTTDTGAVGEGLEGEFPYYSADGRILASAGTGIRLDTVNNKLVVDDIEVGTFQLNGEFNVDFLSVNGTGPALIESGSDIVLRPTADISAENSVIKNLATPTADSHATTKAYVDQQIALYVNSFPRNGYTVDGTTNGIAYSVSGPGLSGVETNPDMILYRGFTYTFDNTLSNSLDPFLIKTSVSAGTSGQFDEVGTYVTGDPDGVVVFEVPHTSTSQLYGVSQSDVRKYITFLIVGE